MNKATIKSAFMKIGASDEFKRKTAAMLREKPPKNPGRLLRPMLIAAAPLVLILALVIGFTQFHLDYLFMPHNVVTTPKMELPKEINPLASYGELLLYDNRVYAYAGTEIDIDNAENLLGDKLGVAKGEVNVEKVKSHHDTEIAADIVGDVYSVKGYDKSFRLMVVSTEADGKKDAKFLENFDGITISSGKDVFAKLKMQGNVSAAGSVQSNGGEIPLNDERLINDFINALNISTPYLRAQISGYQSGDWAKSENFREMKIKLKDGCIVDFGFEKSGYVEYGGCAAVFKMPNSIFNKLWNELGD